MVNNQIIVFKTVLNTHTHAIKLAKYSILQELKSSVDLFDFFLTKSFTQIEIKHTFRMNYVFLVA